MTRSELKQRRESLNLTQQYCAQKLGCKESSLSMWENKAGRKAVGFTPEDYEALLNTARPVQVVIGGFTAYPHCVKCNRWSIGGRVFMNHRYYLRYTCLDCGCTKYRLQSEIKKSRRYFTQSS